MLKEKCTHNDQRHTRSFLGVGRTIPPHTQYTTKPSLCKRKHFHTCLLSEHVLLLTILPICPLYVEVLVFAPRLSEGLLYGIKTQFAQEFLPSCLSNGTWQNYGWLSQDLSSFSNVHSSHLHYLFLSVYNNLCQFQELFLVPYSMLKIRDNIFQSNPSSHLRNCHFNVYKYRIISNGSIDKFYIFAIFVADCSSFTIIF